jgi:hypothetical protein
VTGVRGAARDADDDAHHDDDEHTGDAARPRRDTTRPPAVRSSGAQPLVRISGTQAAVRISGAQPAVRISGAQPVVEPPPTATSPSSTMSATARYLAVGVAALAIGASAVVLLSHKDQPAAAPTVPTVPVAVVTPLADAAVAPAPPIDGAAPTTDASAAPTIATPTHRDPPRHLPGAGSAATPPPTGDGAPHGVATLAPQPMTIGARPWANFFVDDDPTEHQTPETLQLTPGRHRLRFVNPTLKVERSITLEVPNHPDRYVETLE